MKRIATGAVSVLLALLVAGLGLVSSGCEEQCRSVERSYRRSLSAEQTTTVEVEELSGDSAAQFGLALKTELLGDIVDIVVQPTLDAALSLASTVEISGERVRLSTEGDVLDLDLSAHSACDHCFELGAGLGGALVADIPSYGRERAELGGSLAIVAPLLLERGQEADAALKFDLPAMVDIGQSELTTRLGAVDPDIADMVEGPLADLLFDALARQLDPVTLVEFDAPSFGIPDFEVLPVQLVTDKASDTVFAGFATNIEALRVPGVAGVAPITDLKAEENFALAFQPELITHSLSLLMGGDQVSRTYDLSGRARRDGSAHVTLDGFRAGYDAIEDPYTGVDAGGSTDAMMSVDTGFDAGDAGDAGGSTDVESGPDVPIALGFEVFNLDGKDGACFGFGADALGGVSVRDNALQVELVDVRFTSAFLQENLVEASNWLGAEFVQESRSLVSQSLDNATVAVPGTDLSFAGLGLETRPDAVVLRAATSASAVTEASP